MTSIAGLVTNDLPKYIVLMLYLGLNIYLFVSWYITYETHPRYFYIREYVIGKGLAWARAPAALLNLNCMLILLPVCRNLLSYFRKACNCMPRRIRRILDKNIKFHRICAYMIVLNTLIHYFAHTFNVELYAAFRDTGNSSNIIDLLNKQNLNPLYKKPIARSWTVGSVFLLTGGWTGVCITVALLCMVTSSVEFVRRSYFEVFWFTHHLFIVFFGFLVFHGFSGQVKVQDNLEAHDPEKCHNRKWEGECGTKPIFSASPGTWKWVVAPLCLYFFERCVRIARNTQNVEILKVIKHPSRVIELQMRKKGFYAEVGQYVFIKCQQISYLEWHPFTLTSAPEEDYFSVHCRVVGDWTTALAKLVTSDDNKMPIIAVDGPFGTASEDVFDYDVAICVGSGIGVTPFASLLKSVWYKNQEGCTPTKLKKVYFFWICPEINAFEWFGDMLKHLESQLEQINRKDLIEYDIYLTRGWSSKQAKAIFVNEGEKQDAITGLEQKTYYGRPNWDQVFKKTAEKHSDKDIGVFFCGVAALSHILHKMSNKHSSLDGARFHYNKENF